MALQQGIYKWKIKDEETINKILTAKNGAKFKSDVFEIGKLEWRIILCPNGLTQSNKDRFCIYLRLLTMSDKWKYIILCQTISCKQTMNGCTAIVKYERNGQSKGSQNGIYLLSKLKEDAPKSIECSVNITILKITLKNDYILFKHDLSFNSYYNNKQEIKWKIKPKLISKFKNAYPGQPFEDKQNNNWRLVCYPNGNTEKYQGHTGLYLTLCGLPKNVLKIKVEYTFKCEECDISKQDFQDFSYNDSSVGIAKFLDFAELLKNESLTFTAEIKILKQYDYDGNEISEIDHVWNRYIYYQKTGGVAAPISNQNENENDSDSESESEEIKTDEEFEDNEDKEDKEDNANDDKSVLDQPSDINLNPIKAEGTANLNKQMSMRRMGSAHGNSNGLGNGLGSERSSMLMRMPSFAEFSYNDIQQKFAEYGDKMSDLNKNMKSVQNEIKTSNKKLDEMVLKFDGKNQELLDEFGRQQTLYNKRFDLFSSNIDHNNSLMRQLKNDHLKMKQQIMDITKSMNDLKWAIIEEQKMNIDDSTMRSVTDMDNNKKLQIYGDDGDDAQLEERKVSWSDPDKSVQSNDDLDEWNKIKLWMKNEVGLPQYLDAFLDNDLNTAKAIKELNKEELRDIGVKKVLHRRKIMKHVEKINQGQFEL